MNNNFEWDVFLEPYRLAVEDFILKIEGIKNQYIVSHKYCPIELVSGRVKTPASILDKARRLGLSSDDITKVYDIGGIRITCKYVEDVYLVKQLIINRRDLYLVEERDYIKNPKPSGYRSLHLICKYVVETIEGAKEVLLEFQIRTHAMHFWASIEHSLKYKYEKKIPEDLKARLVSASLAAVNLDNEMAEIRRRLEEDGKNQDGMVTADPMEEEIRLHGKR